ncbi:MAG: transporter [Eubacterium sp.]|nr:transporter [Eubacterium sp.]
MEQKKSNSIIYYIILHALLFVYSFSGVCSKMASGEKFLSFKFILFYGGIIAILGVYAIVWQQILKHIPLTTAFCNKAVGIIWGIVWGVVIFRETVTWNMLVGAVIVIIGVIIVVKADE